MAQLTCTDYSLKYLYRIPKTEQDLKIKLMQQGFTEEQIGDTMIYLKSKKYIDDRQYAQLYVGSELVKKGKPVYVIRQKLYQKGVDKHLIQEVLTQYEQDIGEGIEQRIKSEIAKYKKRGFEWFDIIQKLLRKGYKVDQIKKVVKNQ